MRIGPYSVINYGKAGGVYVYDGDNGLTGKKVAGPFKKEESARKWCERQLKKGKK